MGEQELPDVLQERMSDLKRPLDLSGLWASYSDIAKALDYDAKGAEQRHVSRQNWDPITHLRAARADGTSDDTGAVSGWEGNPIIEESRRLSEAFGYYRGESQTKNPDWRASEIDLRMLLGQVPINQRLTKRILDRRRWLVSAAERDSDAFLHEQAAQVLVLLGHLGVIEA